MKVAIKYPRKNFVEANNILELQKELSILMIEKFDIKNSETKPFVDIKLDVETRNISETDFEILLQNNSVIIPTIITKCEL